MIDLDDQQERCLRDVAYLVGKMAEERWLRRWRFLMRFSLTMGRWLRPKKFARWDAERKATYRQVTSWYRR